MNLLAIIGTRPEAIKMAPLLLGLREERGLVVRLCLSGQHRELIEPVLRLFGLEPDLDLALMIPGQSLNAFAGRAIERLDAVLADAAPDRLLVHGDTTTAFAAATAAFHRGVPVAHVEAGLRTHDLSRPFPEEMNRRAVDLIADLLFAPTERARRNLEAERVRGAVHVTGNTAVDAIHLAREMLADDAVRAAADAALPGLEPGRRLVLVTGHRRESFGEGLRSVCAALRRLAGRGDVEIVYPVHLNPGVRGPVEEMLAHCPHIRVVAPLDFLPMVRLMQRADLILTDSGGIQEEAPSLGTPVLVTRAVTERPEAVEAGRARLVGTDAGAIVAAVSELLDDGQARAGFRPGANPYGDGEASARIVSALLGRPFDEFQPR